MTAEHYWRRSWSQVGFRKFPQVNQTEMTAIIIAEEALPERERLADDFVQFRFRLAAAEGEGGGEMLPVLQ